jgi:Fic family protein
LYFQKQYLKLKEKRLDKKQANINKLKKREKAKRKHQKNLDSDRRACIKAKLKIEDIEDDLRDGYSTKKGIQLEKKRRQQKRRVNAYCH